MKNLIERLEKATGPDRELDKAIEETLKRGVFTDVSEMPDEDALEVIHHSPGRGLPWPNYTSSLDAALTLVPKGFCFDTNSVLRGSSTFDVPKAWAQVEEISGPIIENYAAPTLPLALCIAALKAREALTASPMSRRTEK